MIARDIVRPISRSIVSSILGYDTDAQAYFDAVEAASGSFDLTAVDGYDSDFSAGTDGWISFNGTGGVSDSVYNYTPNTSSAPHQSVKETLTLGEEYSFSIDVRADSGNSLVDGVNISNSSGSAIVSESLVAGVWETITGTFTADGANFRVYATIAGSTSTASNGTDFISFRNVRIRNTAYSTYTESYIKTAHSNFYAGLKTDGVWDKLTEFYLLAGKTFDGLTVKGKGTGTLTNNNFVTGDYLGVGTGAGLTGDGSTKYLDTGLSGGSLDGDDHSLSGYVQAFTISGRFLVGMRDGVGVTAGTEILVNLEGHQVRMPFSSAGMATSANGASYLVGSRRGANDAEAYVNGVSDATDTSTASLTLASYPYYLFAANDGGSSLSRSDATLTFAHIGTGLTDTDASNLSTRVNTLMTALGCNVY